MNELRHKYLTNRTLYAVILRADGQIWDGAGFQGPVGANWATYAVPLFEQDITGLYYGDMPNVPHGLYDVIYLDQGGADPSPNDVAVANGPVFWTGTTDLSLGSVLPDALPGSTNGLLTFGTGSGQVNPSGGNVALTPASLDNVIVETDLNLRQAVSLIAAACAGVISGGGTTTITIKGARVNVTRILATVDGAGNRVSILLSPPA